MSIIPKRDKPVSISTELDTPEEHYEIYIKYNGEHLGTIWVAGHLLTIDPIAQAPLKNTSFEITKID